MEALRAELAGAKLGELRRRAKAAGVPPADIETVIDEADNPKAAVVELIIAAEAASVAALEGELALTWTDAGWPRELSVHDIGCAPGALGLAGGGEVRG